MAPELLTMDIYPWSHAKPEARETELRQSSVVAMKSKAREQISLSLSLMMLTESLETEKRCRFLFFITDGRCVSELPYDITLVVNSTLFHIKIRMLRPGSCDTLLKVIHGLSRWKKISHF